MTSKEKIEKAWELVNSKHIETNDEIQTVRFAIRVARELIEKDIHKKIIKETISRYIDVEDYYKVDCYKCPCCEKLVLYDRFQDITLHAKNNHCQHCGQLLDWSYDKCERN